jgi:hypothetical protein
MPQRVSFATTQWKDKPNKPSCYTQTQWDARNSSKFNGMPFASPFAIEPDTNGKFKTYTKTNVDKYVADLGAIQCTSQYGGCRWDIGNQVAQLKLEPVDVTIPCEQFEMKVWDGATYFDMSQTQRTISWTNRMGQSRSGLFGIEPSKLKSASSDYFLPVCGPGTHIQEITRQQAVDLVWRIATLDLDASGFLWEYDINGSSPVSCYDNDTGTVTKITLDLKESVKVQTNNKNKNPSHPTPQEESNLVNLKWEKQPIVGFQSSDSCFAQVGSYSSTCTPKGGDGNVTVNAQVITSGDYTCGWASAYASGAINITTKENIQREKILYFVKDPNGVEKIYLDILGLINLQIAAGAAPYETLNVSNVNVSFLGKTFTVPVRAFTGTDTIDRYGTAGMKVTRTRNFTPGTITLTPKKYYPYANSKGEAVYDVDSGSQLKDPLS